MSIISDLYEQIERCQDCDLAKHRTRVVPGEGPERVDILFIGEAPGWHEDQQGRPFVGPAGQFLEHLLSSIDLRRDQVYIANVIKCRPPANRDPFPREIEACSKWLDQQIELLKPKIIVTLGRYSMAKYFPNEIISKIHGNAKNIDTTICYPMYHPAAALHQGNLRKIIEADILKIPRLLLEVNKIEGVQPESLQLNLF
jgi:uracil-DNA glycosylase family 4